MNGMNEFELLDEDKGIPLFYPHIPKNAIKYLTESLSTRWIGQGPVVDKFELAFENKFFTQGRAVSVNSGTAALHLSYILSDVDENSEVICPVFTCTATNLPILYQKAKPVFFDINKENMNANISEIEKLITPKTRAISVVDYGGVPNDYASLRAICDKNGLKLIADCAHCLDGLYEDKRITEYADFTVYSFQAIKTLTSGDGGMLITRDKKTADKAKRIRWFGINRLDKQKGIWENDITELGYKYHMNDISACIGLASLEEFENIKSHRRLLGKHYIKELGVLAENIIEKSLVLEKFTPWLITLDTKGHRVELMKHLRGNGVESAQVHYRNDRYSIFKPFVERAFPNMDNIENNYLVLPLHTKVSEAQVTTICDLIKEFYANI